MASVYYEVSVDGNHVVHHVHIITIIEYNHKIMMQFDFVCWLAIIILLISQVVFTVNSRKVIALTFYI